MANTPFDVNSEMGQIGAEFYIGGKVSARNDFPFSQSDTRMGRKVRDQSACNNFLNFRTYRYLGDIFFGFPIVSISIGYSLILTAVFFRWAIEKGLLA